MSHGLLAEATFDGKNATDQDFVIASRGRSYWSNQTVDFVFTTQNGQQIHGTDEVPHGTYNRSTLTKYHLTIRYLSEKPAVNGLTNSVYGDIVGYAWVALFLSSTWLFAGFIFVSAYVDVRKERERYKKLLQYITYPAVAIIIAAATVLAYQ